MERETVLEEAWDCSHRFHNSVVSVVIAPPPPLAKVPYPNFDMASARKRSSLSQLSECGKHTDLELAAINSEWTRPDG